LSHFARAAVLDTLEELTRHCDRHITQAVSDEIARGATIHDKLSVVAKASWLKVVRVDGLAELSAFADFARVLGSGERDVGEASTLAWAHVHNAIAIVDERAGTRRGRERGVEVHGTLWLIAEGRRRDLLTDSGCEQLVDALSDTEAWFPCRGAEFIAWARAEGLL
jgi:predicted nucleic acid-binding protein